MDESDKGCSKSLHGPYVLAPGGLSCRPIYPEIEAKEWNQLLTQCKVVELKNHPLPKGLEDYIPDDTSPPISQCMGRVIAERQKNGTNGLYW